MSRNKTCDGPRIYNIHTGWPGVASDGGAGWGWGWSCVCGGSGKRTNEAIDNISAPCPSHCQPPRRWGERVKGGVGMALGAGGEGGAEGEGRVEKEGVGGGGGGVGGREINTDVV